MMTMMTTTAMVATTMTTTTATTTPTAATTTTTPTKQHRKGKGDKSSSSSPEFEDEDDSDDVSDVVVDTIVDEYNDDDDDDSDRRTLVHQKNGGVDDGFTDDDNEQAPHRAHGSAPIAMSTAVLNFDRVTKKVRGLSSKESSQMRQKHVAHRTRLFVLNNDLFRKIKFVNNDQIFQMAIDHLMNHESIPDGKHVKIQMLYESAFNKELNAKRSKCEQAGGHIVRKKIAEMKENGEEFVTIEQICTLQSYSNERNRKHSSGSLRRSWNAYVVLTFGGAR